MLLTLLCSSDFTDHGISYEIVDGEVNTNRAWWPQAEAILGFELGWRLTGDREWLNRIAVQWDYIRRVIVDPREGGEWFNELLEDGSSIGKPEAEEWKCPYHNARMCLRMAGSDIPESF